jgi:hypothetical protein
LVRFVTSRLLIKKTVISELTANIAGWDGVKHALEEIRACHEDTLTFFSGELDEMNLLCDSLLSRGRDLEKQAAHAADIAPPAAEHDDRWDLLLKEVSTDRLEFHEVRQAVQRQVVQLAAVADDVTSARNEFQAVRGELARHNEELSAKRDKAKSSSDEESAGMKNKIVVLENQQLLLEKDRQAMATELELVRSRAAEMAEMLSGQKRSADLQQSQWVEEMRQMRVILETLARQAAAAALPPETSPPAKIPSGVAAAAMSDPVLESVLAQFEVLQQDRLLRRAEARNS